MSTDLIKLNVYLRCSKDAKRYFRMAFMPCYQEASSTHPLWVGGWSDEKDKVLYNHEKSETFLGIVKTLVEKKWKRHLKSTQLSVSCDHAELKLADENWCALGLLLDLMRRAEASSFCRTNRCPNLVTKDKPNCSTCSNNKSVITT
jgi:hypothetical protein